MEIPSKSVTEALAAFESSADRLSDVVLTDITALSTTDGGDLTVLQAIEAYQSLVSTKIDTLKATLSRAYASGRQTCNDRLPIHRLPSELLILIFKMVLQPWTFKSFYKQAYRLASICSRWRALIDGTPSFWTMISSMFPSNATAGIINKSGNAPLIVDNYLSSTQTGPDIVDLHTDRWYALHLAGTREESEIILAKRRLPRLAFLTLLEPGLRSLSPITNECCPVLEGFHLVGSRLSAYASNFRTLRCLALRDLTEDLCPLTSLMTVLRQNPLLQDIFLATVRAEEDDDIPESDLLELPYLTRFDMDDVNSLVVIPILRALRAPKLKKLHIGMADHHIVGNTESVTVVPSICSALSFFTVASAPITRLILYVTPERNSLWYLESVGVTCRESNGLHYRFYIKYYTPLDGFLSDLREAFGPKLREIITEIHIGETTVNNWFGSVQENLTEEHLSALGTRLDNAETICICQYRLWDDSGATAICSTLSTPSSGVFPFPQLQTLDLPICKEGAESLITTMLQKRYHDDASTDVVLLRRLNLRTGLFQTIAGLDEISRLVAPGLLSTDAHGPLEKPECWGLAELEEWFSPPASTAY